MDNKRDTQYNFCPKCGALARDGVCTSCGHVTQSMPIEPIATPVVEPITEAEPAVAAAIVEAEAETVVEAVTAEAATMEQAGTQPQDNPYIVYSEQNPYAQQPNSSNFAQQPNTSNQAQQDGYYGSPYSEYANRTAYTNGAIPPDVPVKKSNGKVWVIVGVCAAIFIALIVLLGVAIGNLVSKINESSNDSWEDAFNEYEDDDFLDDFYDDYEDDYNYEDFYNDITERAKENQGDSEPGEGGYSYEDENGKTYGYSAEDDYYAYLNDYLRDDLSYSVTFEMEEYYEDDKDVYIYCSYPVLAGDIPNIDHLNQYIYEEYLYFLDYYKENVEEHMEEDGYFYSYIDAYVTYMDEEVISIVFDEEADWEEYYMVSLYCVNIDLENGVVLDNTEILDIDDEFSVDFRIREAEQNDSDTLDVYTDQELTEMLSNPDDLILFYTPLGMEVGINHDYGWSTATYKDFEKYLKQF